MEHRSGVRFPRLLIWSGLLLTALFIDAAAAVPSPLETVYRKARVAASQEPSLALKIAEDALRTATNKDEWYWALYITRGEMLASLARRVEARQILDPELPVAVRKTEAAVRRLIALSNVAFYEDKADLGLKYAKDAVTLAAKHVPAALGDAYLRRGQAALSDGDLREALRLARLAKNEILAANAEASLAYIYYRGGRYSDALEIAERIMPRLIALQMKRSAQTTSGNLASLYDTLGDYETAKEVFSSTQAELGRMGLINERIVFLDRLGDAYLATRDLDNAARWYDEAARLAKAQGHRQYPRALSNLAKIAIARGRFEEARTLIEDAIKIDTASEDPEDVLRAQVIRARLDIATGRADTAERDLKKIIATTGASLTKWEAEARLGDVYVSQKRNDLADRSFALALDVASEARAELKEDHRFSFFNGVAELFESYVNFLVDNNQIERALEVTEESRARTLAEGLNTARTPRKFAPRAVAKQSGATILCYWLGSKRSYVWTVTPSAVTLQRLPPAAQIEADADQYRNNLIATLGATLESSAPLGQKLFRTLVEPAIGAGLANGSKVIVIADGRLHSLNFETLVVPSPKPHWWIEDVILTSAGSLELLGRDVAAVSPKPSLLLIGDPPAAPAFPKLPQAAEEMERVGKHFAQKKVFRGAEAKPSAFLEAAPSKFDLIHFVAHGTASRKKPLDSAVILAKEKTGDSYKLYARQIMKQRLTARLVTISSCEGAGTRSYAGEGLVGLAWAFLRAGAGQVIAALWNVDDRSTTDLMQHLYEGIRRGLEPAVALRNAKLALLRSGTIHRKPKYWAPFVLYDGS